MRDVGALIKCQSQACNGISTGAMKASLENGMKEPRFISDKRAQFVTLQMAGLPRGLLASDLPSETNSYC